MKKVGYIVLTNFKNDSRVLKQIKSLAKQEFDIRVVALYDEGLFEKEEIYGGCVHRIKLKTKKLPKNTLFQLIKYFEFTVKSIKKLRGVQIVQASSISPLPIAILLKIMSFGKVKVIYDARELETQTTNLYGFKKKLVEILEKISIRFTNNVITVSNSIAEYYKNRYAIPMPKVIFNSPFFQQIEKNNYFREKYQIEEGKKIFLYQGGLTSGRGIELILEAFEKIKREDAVIIFMGYGPLEKLVKEFSDKSNKIYYHEAVPPDKLLNYTASADIGIVYTRNTCLSHYYSLPNKFFEYSMAGLPIICNNLQEMKKIIDKYKCGIVSEKESVESILVAIDSILEQDLMVLGNNSKKVANDFKWENQESVYLNIFNSLKCKI